MRLHISGRTHRGLRLETLALIDRIRELGECVGVLPPKDDQLETLHEARVVLSWPRERGDLDRVVEDERGLAQTRLHVLLEQVVQLLAHGVAARVLEHKVRHPLAPERWREIYGFALIGAL